MSRMSSLGIAISGLNTAQAGLYVTGHNMSNVNTTGYSRQRVLQHDFLSITIGSSHSSSMQVGLGTDITAINQIRNKFLDASYRDEASRGNFYAVKAEAGSEVQTILGELQSDYRAQAVIDDLWEALNELSTYQPGLDTRGNFISTAITLIDKANNVYDRLFDYQHNLNDQIRQSVMSINNLVEKVRVFNTKIKEAETTGDNANDYRDARNLALDELSGLLDLEIKQRADGTVDLLVNSKDLLVNNLPNKLGLKYTSDSCKFVEPVFTSSESVLPVNEPYGTYIPLYTLTSSVDANVGIDKGKLKALLVSRGYEPANYTSPKSPDLNARDTNGNLMYTGEDDPLYILQQKKYNFDAFHSLIPKVQREFDILINSIVKMVNNAVSPVTSSADGTHHPDTENAPYGLEGIQTFQEVFVRKVVPRFISAPTDEYPDINPDDPSTWIYNEEDPYNYSSLYTIGNLQINPLFLNAGGYNELALSKNGDIEDNSVVLDMLEQWSSAFIELHPGTVPLNIGSAYQDLLTSLATEVNESISYADEQRILVANIDSKRQSISGVSMDEEMQNMLRYQHSFNAASRIVNIIDSMLDRVINNTGRVGT